MSPAEDLVADSGATSNMNKDRDMFVSLDENFKGSVSNANFSESKILGKGEVRFRVKDEKSEFKMIELKNTLYVPENSRNLLSIKNEESRNRSCFWCELVCSSAKWFSLPIKRGKRSFYGTLL